MFSIVFAVLIFSLMILISSKGVDLVYGETVISTISVEKFPQAIVFNPANNNIYVANRDSGTVSVIESANNTVINNIEVGMSPQAIVFNPADNNIYVANTISNSISIIDSNTNTVIKEVDVGRDPVALEFNPADNNIYVANYGS